MRLHIDRTLPVPLGAQLQGQIEYGLAYGEISPGSKLPSIRELAAELGISPVTVSQVYRALQEKELIVTKAGNGTFVRDDITSSQGSAQRLLAVHKLIDQLALTAERQGIDVAELAHIINLRLNLGKAAKEGINIVFIGIFPRVTDSYVADIRRQLRPHDTIEPFIFEQLSNASTLKKVRQADLALTFAHRANELCELLGGKPRVAAVNFIPSERTRMLLAELDPLVRLGIVSTYPEFLATFRAGIRRFAPHVEVVAAAVLGTEQVDAVVSMSDVVVYATGSDGIVDKLPRHVRAFEYRHSPDPRSVEQVVLPVIEELRSGK